MAGCGQWSVVAPQTTDCLTSMLWPLIWSTESASPKEMGKKKCPDMILNAKYSRRTHGHEIMLSLFYNDISDFHKTSLTDPWPNSENLRDYLSNQYAVFLPSPHNSTLFHISGVGKSSPLLDCVCVFLVWLRCSRVSLMVPRMHCGCGRGQWDTWDATQCGIFCGHIFSYCSTKMYTVYIY